MEEYGEKWQSSPISVWPSMKTLASTLVFLWTLTFSPIKEYGPILTPESNRALGWTVAVE
jgi:hypothetical protein